MDLGLTGKTAIVTGGSEGIGYATAAALAREGARVVIAARREDVLNASAEQIGRKTGGEVTAIPTDVSRADGVEHLIRTAVDRLGRLDALVNNAGTSRAAKFETVTDEVWQEDLDLKLFGAIRACRLALPHLRAAGGGSIVNLLNIGAKQPAAASVPTSVSRAAGMALTKALSKELAQDNIRVNAVLIGLIKSMQHERRWQAQASGQSLDDHYAGMARARS